MSNTDLKTVAEYISDTFNPATHLHYYETAEEADGKEDDLYEFFNDMQDTLNDYLDSRKKFRTELTGNSHKFISVNYNDEIENDESRRTCMATIHKLITKFCFSGSGFSEELTEHKSVHKTTQPSTYDLFYALFCLLKEGCIWCAIKRIFSGTF